MDPKDIFFDKRAKLTLVYLLLAFLIFIIELIIALNLHSGILRTWGGDVLVVMMLYFFFRAILPVHPWKVAVGVLVFAFVIEISQYFHLIEVLGLQDNFLARMVLGNTFEWTDFLAYTLGVLLALWIDERVLRQLISDPTAVDVGSKEPR